MSEFGETLDRLASTIASRRGADPKASWSARLIAEPELAAKKLAEEAVELALALVASRREAVILESADLIYHWLAALEAGGVSLDEVGEALRAREGLSGVAEKASRA